METKGTREAIKKIANSVGIGYNTPSSTARKMPNSTLRFEEIKDNISAFTIGFDGKYYVIGTDGKLKVYEDLLDDTGTETGFTWTSDDETILKFVVMPAGITLFTNNAANGTCRIYHTSNVNVAPTQIGQYVGRWSPHFGMDTYYNGLEEMILTSVYGGGQRERELLLSTDGGQSFNVIKKTRNLDSSGNFNSHWHDVSIDVHRGWLWVSEGDGLINQAVHYSEDLGSTWVEVDGSAVQPQPTAILPFPDKVVFGRDSLNVGVNVSRIGDTVGPIVELQEFKDWYAYKYFAQSPMIDGSEAYMSFYLYDDSELPVIVASGDFGETWHKVWLGIDNFTNLVGLDDNFVIAQKENKLMVSKRVSWV